MLATGFRLYPKLVPKSDVFVNASLGQPDCDTSGEAYTGPTRTESNSENLKARLAKDSKLCFEMTNVP